MQTLDVFSFPLQGSRLIEASAGTGKTFTIALLYTRLILGHGENEPERSPLTTDQILVMTFTDAAAEELRDRIRTRLTEAARYFATPELNEDTILVSLRDQYPADAWQQYAQRLSLAAQNMDQSFISTIHSWCLRILKEYAFRTQSLFQQTLLTDMSELLSTLCKDYWRQVFYELNERCASLVKHVFSSPDDLLSYVQPLLNQNLEQTTLNGSPIAPASSISLALNAFADQLQRIAEAEQSARQDWLAHHEEAVSLIAAYRSKLNANVYSRFKDDQTFADRMQAIYDWAATGSEPPNVLVKFATGNWHLKKNQGEPPAHPVFDSLAEWVALKDEFSPDTIKREVRSTVTLHAANWINQARLAHMQKQGEMGFDDLLLQLDRALHGPQGDILAQQLRVRLPAAMIDEFQDTDPIQFRIVQRIYRLQKNDPDTALVLIGDPKQAIYSFRNADIHTYLYAKQLCGDRLYSLGTNFRSTQSLVDSVNTLFVSAEDSPNGAFLFRKPDENPLPFFPVNAKGLNATLQHPTTPAVMTLWHARADQQEKGVLSKSLYQQAMTTRCVSTIKALLEDHQHCYFTHSPAGLDEQASTAQSKQGIQPRDIALLVRNRNEARIIQDALQQAGLASVFLSVQDSVFNTQEAEDIWHWLRACAQPGNETRVRAALASSTLKLSLDEMQQLLTDEIAWESQMERFKTFETIWQSQGVLAMLRRFIHSYGIDRRQLQDPLNGARTLTNLLHLAEFLQKASREYHGTQALIRHYNDVLQNNNSEELLRLESDDDLIRIITIHKSKGLQYPLVFLPFICSPPFQGAQSNRSHIAQLPDNPGAPRRIELDARNSEDAKAIQAHEQLAEDLRLLYVALTRAEHALWIGCASVGQKANAKTSALPETALGYLLKSQLESEGGTLLSDDALLSQALQKLAGSSDGITLQSFEPDSLDAENRDNPPEPTDSGYHQTNIADYRPARRIQHSVTEHWWIASYSALKKGVASDLEPELAVIDQQREEREAEQDLAQREIAEEIVPDIFHVDLPGLHGMHRGAEAGTLLHELLEWAFNEGICTTLSDTERRQSYLTQRLTRHGWEQELDRVDHWLCGFLSTSFQSGGHSPLLFSELNSFQVELEFLFPVDHVSTEDIDQLCQQYLLPGQPRPRLSPVSLNGMLKGFIDLVFCYQGRYFVVDWKSNWLGQSDTSYHREAMHKEILDKRYDVQYAIYLLALHRLLSYRKPDYQYEKDIGAALYFFLRGWQSESQGVFTDKPDKDFIEKLDAVCLGQALKGKSAP